MVSLDSPIARLGPWLAVAVVATAALGVALVGSGGERAYGGDFPSFYAAGSIVLDGNGDQLYEPTVQQAAQADLLPDGRFLYFAYPPFTAAAYATMAWLPYGAAFVLHTVLAIAALVAAVVAFRPLARGLLDGPTRLGIAVGVALATYPVVRAVLGGQNATFTLLLFVLVARFDSQDRPTAAGLAAAAMLYKPQFGILVLVVLLVGRRWRSVATAAAASSGLFAVGAVVSGVGWLATWFDAVLAFADENLVVNGDKMVAMLGWLQNAIGREWGTVAVALALLVVLAMPLLREIAMHPRAEISWYAISPIVVLAAPSALYYDTALVLVVPAVAFAWFRPAAAPGAIAVIGLSWIGVAGDTLGWNPLFVPIVALAVMFAIGSVRGHRIRVTPTRYTR
ncbi:MAG: glycosyltransferase family 87 protein [Acidimicrobiia bacterium]